MQFFLDTADVHEISALVETGLVDGVTTNPSLIAKSGRQFIEAIKEICALVPGPVSAEVAATDFETMLAEGEKLAGIAKNVVVKVPLTYDGLRVCKILSGQGVPVNVTLCFSANQALLAAKAGAAYISPFVGRLDDIGQDGMELIHDILDVYSNYPEFYTQVLAASIRHPQHVLAAAKAGAHVATMPASTLKQLYHHPLTDKGLAAFVSDWAKTGQRILDVAPSTKKTA
ncbi:MAG: fructose-6-phosphate aldolase [Alphaproteobacteria bacterium]|jgi:transaldolase|nr:fructose-6-phosphate aldolase [Alphaproteobacteria bacterium]